MVTDMENADLSEENDRHHMSFSSFPVACKTEKVTQEAERAIFYNEGQM